MKILDSGDRHQFDTGAVRDMQEGKGRCDLVPLRVASVLLGGDRILDHIATFLEKGDTAYLYGALSCFALNEFENAETMLLEVAHHFEEGAKKYGENNWQKGLPTWCYINSAIRHYLKHRRGDTDEPHNRAFVWNLACCVWEINYHNYEEDKK